MSALAPALRRLALAAALAAALARADDGRKKQEIVFDEVPAHVVGDGAFTLSAKSTSGLPLAFEVVSGPAVLDGKKLRLTGSPGLVIVRASQGGNPAFLPAASAERVIVVRPLPSPPVLHTQPMGVTVGVGEPILLSVEASGEPDPTLQWRKDGIALSGATDRRFAIAASSFGDAGTYDVVATNPSGSARSEPARVTVGKRRQVITFLPPTNPVAGQPVTLSATASSGLPVQFDIVSGVALLSGQTLNSPSGGTVVVQASQRGDTNYEAASPVAQTFIFTLSPNLNDNQRLR
jgi:hypothetical protein